MVEGIGTMKDLKTKYGDWALITGASSGIGLCFAEELSRLGFNLILVARNEDKLDSLSQSLSEKSLIKCEVIATDLAKEESVKVIIQRTKTKEINLLINNAGYALTGEFLGATGQSHTDVMKINSVVPMQLSHHFGQKMKAKGKGGIINVSSISGTMPLPYWSVYAASKAFLKSLSEALWYELKPKGVDVLAICPGTTKTNFHETAGMRSSGLSAKQVVDTALQNLGKRPSVIVGANNLWLVSFITLLPIKLRLKLGAIGIDRMKV